MSNITYDFDYCEERQNEIIKKIERYVPLLENLICLFYPELKFSVACSLSHRVNLFAGYYEPKIEIIAENLGEFLRYSSSNINITFKIKDTVNFLNATEFCDSVYTYLPDALYYTTLIIKDNQDKDFELSFEEYALRKEVENIYFNTDNTNY